MKAIILEQYGHADELKVAEVDMRKLRDNDVLIEVKATSTNPVNIVLETIAETCKSTVSKS